MDTILIVDDNSAMRDQYAYDLKRLGGFSVLTAKDGGEGLDVLREDSIDCVVLDLEMPGVDGFEVLERMKLEELPVPVIVYTGTGNYDRCVRAVQLGAYGFLDKAEPTERIVQEIRNALAHRRLRDELVVLRRLTGEEGPLLGKSAAMARMREEIERLAPIPSPVLIVGESGTGKELVARQLHSVARAEPGPFLAVNCASLPDNLVESELFGHERGAFTGADRLRKGAFESADGGTLLLDEIGELPSAVQAKLLRVLEEESVRRVGGSKEIPVAARVVAATHRDLEAAVAGGEFRQDLLYRLNVHTILVPPLRERLTDIPILVEGLSVHLFEKLKMPMRQIAEEAVSLLARYDWRKNNVRELRNAIERMIIASGTENPITAAHVPLDLREAGGREPSSRTGPDSSDRPSGKELNLFSGSIAGKSLKTLKSEAERDIVMAALEEHGWHITKTAEALDLADHSSLLKVMRRHGLRR